MTSQLNKSQIALAVAAAVGAAALVAQPAAADAQTTGQYVAGDIHNHTTCSDGSTSMQRLLHKSTDRTTDTPWGLDWFVQAGHGGNGNRNCTLVEDASLDTPAYPFTGEGPGTTWVTSGVTVKGDVSGSGATRNMWRWQSIQQIQYPLVEYFNELLDRPLFIGIESIGPGHEHIDVSVLTDQIPRELEGSTLPTTPGYTAIGNADALAMWEYCFDRADSDTSRGNLSPQPSTDGNNWDCSVPGSLNASDPNWNAAGMKLVPLSGPGVGERGHAKTLEALKWLAAFHPQTSYYIPTHLERAGPFNPDGNNGFNVEHLRNFNNTAPNIAFGFETQPGHHGSENRGEYRPLRQNIGGMQTDSVGGTTYGGTGVYGAVIGGVWDSLLGEGRNFWFFGSSDWHSRGDFGSHDRRTTNDFYPGEYQRNYAFVETGDKIRPQPLVDGLRTGNNFVVTGHLIDRLAFVACASYPGFGLRTNAQVEAIAVAAATTNSSPTAGGCATMGQKLKVRPGATIVVSVVVRDPDGANYSPYVFSNPSLAQIGVEQPLNQPVLDHIDLIRGLVTGYRTPGAPDYAGEWPRNTDWLRADGTTADLSVVPAAAKNTTAAVINTWNSSTWKTVTSEVDGTTYLQATYRIPAVSDSQYVRLRGTNLPPSVPYETDADGNPLADLYTNSGSPDTPSPLLSIPCTVTGSNVPDNGATYTEFGIDGCPNHLVTAPAGSPIEGQKAVSVDIAAWSDLWFYANPIYVEVAGSVPVAGVQ